MKFLLSFMDQIIHLTVYNSDFKQAQEKRTMSIK